MTHACCDLLFVYGTLKRDEINYPHWMLTVNRDGADDVCQFVGEAITTERFPLFVNSPKYTNCSPCLLPCPGKGNHVHGEVFRVSRWRRETLDVLEGVASGVYVADTIQVRLKATGEVITASAYFRGSKFDEDWESSRPLLGNFSAVQCLRAEPGVYHCIPAHLRFPNLSSQRPCVPKPMVLVILDGIGDVSYPQLGGLTPLKYASKQSESLSTITRYGVSGMMDPFISGLACGSDTAHLSLLGYDPTYYYRGRGAFESLGADMSMEEERDVAFKCNFSVLDESTGIVTARRCDREFTEEGPQLCAALDGLELRCDIEGRELEHGPHVVRVKYATEHRCGLVIGGDYLTDEISGTDPLSDNLPLVQCRPTQNCACLAKSLYTCRVVMAASQGIAQILRVHPINRERMAVGKTPANIVLLRGAAMRNEIPSFERRHGMSGFMVAPTCIIRGLGRCCGLDVVDSDGGTGDYHSNIPNKAKKVVEVFSNRQKQDKPYHFAILHVKGTDDAGHDSNPNLKADMLIRCGEAISILWDGLEEGSTICVTGDHSTLCSMEDHSTEPVPVSIAKIPPRMVTGEDGDEQKGQSSFRDKVTVFSEDDCRGGALGRFRGGRLLEAMKKIHFQ